MLRGEPRGGLPFDGDGSVNLIARAWVGWEAEVEMRDAKPVPLGVGPERFGPPASWTCRKREEDRR